MFLKPPVSDRDHGLGPNDAPVTLVEYGDYECPMCGAAFPITQELLEEYGDEIRLVFRNFPLTRSHPNALLAARAAEAAAVQGRFWEMHDALYENQSWLEPDDLTSYADNLGLDGDQFISDLNSSKTAERVQEDIHSGMKSGVNGTPTFFINGVRHNGNFDFESLRQAIELELMKVSQAKAG